MSYVADWDSGQPGAYWDRGLQWDWGTYPPTGDVGPYLDLVTSEHQPMPNYMAMLAATLQPLADGLNLLQTIPALYDLDLAIGEQLDTTGLWIGVTRDISEPLPGVYFSFDIPGLGFDQGTWYNQGEPLTGLVVLPDANYRTLLYARAAANQWDGTVEGAYAVWNVLFEGTGYGILIQDLDDMHIVYALTGPVPDAVTLALFTGGYLNLVSAGVMVDAYLTPTMAGTPFFGFGVENSSISGFGTGAWANVELG